MKLAGGDWSKGDLIALISLAVTVAGLIVAIKSMPAEPEAAKPLPTPSATTIPVKAEPNPQNKNAGIWSGTLPNFTEHNLQSGTGCAWDVSLSDITMRVAIDDAGKIETAKLHFNYDEYPLVTCGSLKGKYQDLIADLHRSRLTGDEIYLYFPYNEADYPPLIATFNGNIQPESMSGKLSIRRTGEQQQQLHKLNEWTWNLPTAQLDKKR
jgi:hypothetical protein